MMSFRTLAIRFLCCILSASLLATAMPGQLAALAPSSSVEDQTAQFAAINTALLKLLEAEKNKRWKSIAKLGFEIREAAAQAREDGRFDFQEGVVLTLMDDLIVPYRMGNRLVVFRLNDPAKPLETCSQFEVKASTAITPTWIAQKTGWVKVKNLTPENTLSLLSALPAVHAWRSNLRGLDNLAASCAKIMQATQKVRMDLLGREPHGMSSAKVEQLREATKLVQKILKEKNSVESMMETVQKRTHAARPQRKGRRTKPSGQVNTEELQNRLELLERDFGALEFALERFKKGELPADVKALFDQNPDPDFWVQRGYVFLLDSQGNYLDAHKGNNFGDKVLQWQKDLGMVWVYGVQSHGAKVRAVRHMPLLVLKPAFRNAETVALGYASGIGDRLYPVYAMDCASFRKYMQNYEVPITAAKTFLDFQQKIPGTLTQEFPRYCVVGPDNKQLVLQVRIRASGRIRDILARHPELAQHSLVLINRLDGSGMLSVFPGEARKFVDDAWAKGWVTVPLDPENLMPVRAILRNGNGDVREARTVTVVRADGSQRQVDYFFARPPQLRDLAEYLRSDDVACVRVEGVVVPKDTSAFWPIGGLAPRSTHLTAEKPTVTWIQRQGEGLNVRTKLLSEMNNPAAMEEELTVAWPARRISKTETLGITDETLRSAMLAEGFDAAAISDITKEIPKDRLVDPARRALVMRMLGRISCFKMYRVLLLPDPEGVVQALETLMDEHGVEASLALPFAMDEALAAYGPEDLAMIGRLVRMDAGHEPGDLSVADKQKLKDLSSRHARVLAYDDAQEVVHLNVYPSHYRPHKLNLREDRRLSPVGLNSADIAAIQHDSGAMNLDHPPISAYQFYDAYGNLLAYHRGDIDESFDKLLEYLMRERGKVAVAGFYMGEHRIKLESVHYPKMLALKGSGFPPAGEVTFVFDKGFLGKSLLRTVIMNADFQRFLKERNGQATLDAFLAKSAGVFPRYIPKDVFVKTPQGEQILHTLTAGFASARAMMTVLKDARGFPLHIALPVDTTHMDFGFFPEDAVERRYVFPWERRGKPAKRLRWEIAVRRNGLDSRIVRTNANGSEVVYVFNVEISPSVRQSNRLFQNADTDLVEDIRKTKGGRIHLPTSKEYVALVNAMAEAGLLTQREAELTKHWWRDRGRNRALTAKPVSEMTEVEKQFARRTGPTGAYEIFILDENGAPLPGAYHTGTNLDPLIGKIKEALQGHSSLYIYGIKLGSVGAALKRPLLHSQVFRLDLRKFKPDQRVVHQVQRGAFKDVEEILPVCTIGQAQFDKYLAKRKPGQTLEQFLKRRPLKPYTRYYQTRKGSDGPAAAAHLEEMPRGGTLWECLRASHPAPIFIEHYRRTSEGRMNLMPQSSYAYRRIGPVSGPSVWTNARMRILKDGILTEIFPRRGPQVLMAQFFVPLDDALTRGNALFSQATQSGKDVLAEKEKVFLPKEEEMPKILADLERFKILPIEALSLTNKVGRRLNMETESMVARST